MALPLKKRPYRGSEYSLAKRVKRVERIARSARPEMKAKEYTVPKQTVGPGALFAGAIISINQGSQANQHLGVKAKMFRMEIRGIADPSLDLYLVQSKSTTAPVYADFQPGPGGHIKSGGENLIEWRYLRLKPDQVADCPFRITQSFKNGFNLEFAGTTSILMKNQMYIVARNNTASSQYITYSYKVWFTDA